MKNIGQTTLMVVLSFLFSAGTGLCDSVASLTLINADTDSDIQSLGDGDTLNLAALPTRNLNVRANTSPATVGSVKFGLDGNDNYQVESVAPYALAGDSSGDYNAWTPSVGSHRITSTPYTEAGAGGTAGTSLIVNFTVSDDFAPSDPLPAGIYGELKKWHKTTIIFDGPETSETAGTNPFLDYRLNVTFSHAGSGKSYVVPGYYAADGNAADTGASSGNKWAVHFAPDEIGEWTYAVSFRTGVNVAVDSSPTAGASAGFCDGDSGSFTIAASDKTGRDFRGKGLLQYVGEHYLQFAETGEYFLKQGSDSPENLLAYEDFDNTPDNGGRRKSWSPHAGDWQSGDPSWQGGKGTELIGAVNYLAGEGMNAISFLTMSADGDDKNVFPWRGSTDYQRYDVSKCAQWEVVFEHMDREGIYLHFKTQETENDQKLDGGALGTDRKLYYRELIARFGHHLALNWNIGEENTNTDQQRKDFAQFFYDNDPYRHHVVVHTYPGAKDAVYTPLLGSNSKYTGASLQGSNANFSDTPGDVATWVQNSAASGKKWVVAVDEPGDATHALRPDDDAGNSHEDGRKNGIWGTFLAGGWGNEWYFGYAHANSDLTCEDFRSRDQWWNYCRYALEFFKNNNIPVQTMQNDNSKSTAANDYCFYKQGEVYVVYLKNGGTTTLDLANAGGDFVVKWFDPRNGGSLQDGTVTAVTGGDSVSLGSAPNNTDKDWAILVASATLLEAAFLEEDGIVAFEVESLNPVSPWSEESSVSGYSGEGYFRGTIDSFNTGGQGTVSYPIYISSAGRYQLQWRSRITFGNDNTEYNDSFARLVDADRNPVSPVPNDNDATGSWYKVYMNTVGNWIWEASNKDNDAKSLSWNLEAGTLYYFEISVRSEHHAVDRIVLWDHAQHSFANKSTGKQSDNSALDALSNSEFRRPNAAPSEQMIAYIYGDVAEDGTIPSGSAAAYDQMLLTDTGTTGLSRFKTMVEDEGYTISQYYDAETTLDATFLNQFEVIIFGLHQKIWSAAEKTALDSWLQAGGSALFYSDSAAGGKYSVVGAQNPVGQTVVNNVIAAYGMQVLVDQANGIKAYRAGPDAAHPIVVGRPVLEGEGVSPVAVDPDSSARVLIPYLDDPDYKVSGDPVISYTQNMTIPNPDYAALAYADVGAGRIMTLFDRQPFWNDGPGSDIDERDNRELLRRIVRYLADDLVAEYTLTVNSGSGDGVYLEGTVVNVTADAAPSGQVFDVWTGDTANVAHVNVSSTTITMPESSASITATYRETSAGDVVAAINCGGDSYTAVDGTPYSADMHFTGGDTYTTTGAIAGTEDDTLYQTERYGEHTYDITVPNGKYDLLLQFAEIYFETSGARIFDIAIEDAIAVDNLDIYARAGHHTAYDVLVGNVTVSDNTLTVRVLDKVENGKLNAFRIMAGSGMVDTDEDGIDDIWEQSNFDDLTTAGADTDYDDDGASDLYEYKTHTDPKDPDSFFGIVSLKPTASPDMFAIDWKGTDQAAYTVEISSNLNGPWNEYTNGIVGSAMNTLNISTSSPALFLRVLQE